MAKKRHAPEQVLNLLRQVEVGIANGKTVNESMRQAILLMISQNREPYYWASFVLNGKDQVLKF